MPYTIYVRNRADAKEAWDAFEWMRRNGFCNRGREGGHVFLKLPVFHRTMRAREDPHWMQNDAAVLKKIAMGIVDCDVKEVTFEEFHQHGNALRAKNAGRRRDRQGRTLHG